MTPESSLAEFDPRDEKFLAYCEVTSRAAAALVFLAGTLNLLGWYFNRNFLLWTSPHGVVIAASAAGAFVLSGASLWLSQGEAAGRFPRFAADVCAFLVAALGILNLSGYIVGRDPGIDLLFAHAAPEAGMNTAATMAPNAALNLALLGGALLFSRGRRGGFAACAMAGAAGVVSLLGLIGYAYQVESLVRFGAYKPIAFQATLLCAVLATGILFKENHRGLAGYLSRDAAGSIMARRLLPAVVLVPVLFGLLRIWGGHMGLFREKVGVVLMVIFNMATLAAMVWWSSSMLNRSERERRRADRHRKDREQELARVADLLEKVFSNIHLKIAYMDPQFHILRVNEAYAEAGGHPPGFFVGRNHFDLYPDEENEAIFRRVVGTGESFSVSAKAFVYPEHPERGTTYWDWSLQPVKETDGTVIGLVLSLVDVTETVRGEMRLREKEVEAVRRDKMAILGEMAAGIAHEIRNPLSGLNFSLSTAETVCNEMEGIDREAREVMKRTFASSRAASTKIGEVVRRVLDFVRPGKAVMEQITINDAVKDALDLIAPMLRKNGIRVDTALSEDLPRCNGDLLLMEQLFLNLINNAMQAMESGGGEKRIEISSRTEGDRILLAVADSGPGVSESLREKIFAPFFTTRPAGTGLGLSISRRIVSVHNGFIEVGKSRFGGAEFRVSIPVSAECVLPGRT